VSQLELLPGAAGDDPVVVRGDVDMATAPQLRSLLDELVDAGVTTIVLDCRALEFLDSSGIGVLVAARKRLGDQGQLVIDSPPAHVRKVLDITGVAGHLTVR
jgi:anti-sigma B factor antagonist